MNVCVCYGVGKKMKKKKKEERTKKKNLISYATDVALFLFVHTSHFSHFHIYMTKISRSTQHLPIAMNDIGLMNNTFMRTKKRVQV